MTRSHISFSVLIDAKQSLDLLNGRHDLACNGHLLRDFVRADRCGLDWEKIFLATALPRVG